MHLWLGLILGLFLSVFGITGSILVFHQEIEEWLNPGLLTVRSPEAGAPYQPFERLQEAGEAPEGLTSTVIPGAAPLSITQAIAIGRQRFPNAVLMKVIKDTGGTGGGL